MLADALTIAVGLALCFAITGSSRPEMSGARLAVLAVVVGSVWLASVAANKLYMARAIERPSEELRRLLVAGMAGASAVVVMAFFVQSELPSRLWIVSLYGIVSAALIVERRIARHVFARLRAAGRINRRVAIVGTDTHAMGLLQQLQSNPSLGYEVVGLIGEEGFARRGRTILGELDHTGEILREHECVGALISLSSITPPQVNRLTRDLTDQGFHVALSTSLRDIDVTRMRPQGIDGQTLIYVEPTIRTGWRSHAKRVFDLLVATIGLVLTAPFIAVAAAAIKLESEGPVLFRQQRVGRNGEPFMMIKLRTMYADAEARRAELLDQNESDGPLFKIKDDPRITKVGRVLRKLSIDELPQFWNVFRGDMSVVGPRPALPSEVVEWDDELHDRLRVLPGITGIWQISGRADTSFDDYKRLDLYYVDNWSLLHDVRIVLKTFGAVVFGRGAS